MILPIKIVTFHSYVCLLEAKGDMNSFFIGLMTIPQYVSNTPTFDHGSSTEESNWEVHQDTGKFSGRNPVEKKLCAQSTDRCGKSTTIDKCCYLQNEKQK